MSFFGGTKSAKRATNEAKRQAKMARKAAADAQFGKRKNNRMANSIQSALGSSFKVGGHRMRGPAQVQREAGIKAAKAAQLAAIKDVADQCKLATVAVQNANTIQEVASLGGGNRLIRPLVNGLSGL